MNNLFLFLLLLPFAAIAGAQHEGPLPLDESESGAAKVKPSSPGARPYDFKGDALGMSLTAFKKAHGMPERNDSFEGINCSVDLPESDFVDCSFRNGTIAGKPAKMLTYKFVGRLLFEIAVTFDRSHYGEVRAAFAQKFGEPKDAKVKEYQNAFGATFQGEVSLWNNGLSSIMLTERMEREESSAILVHRELAKEAARREAKYRPQGPDI